MSFHTSPTGINMDGHMSCPTTTKCVWRGVFRLFAESLLLILEEEIFSLRECPPQICGPTKLIRKTAAMISSPHMAHSPCRGFGSINDGAVDLLRNGKFREAVDVLANGLKQVGQNIKAQEFRRFPLSSCPRCRRVESPDVFRVVAAQDGSFSTTIHEACTLPSLSCSRSRLLFTSDDDTQGHDDTGDYQDTTVSQDFLFSCPMLAPLRVSSDDISEDRLIFAMIYNLALGYDLLSLSKGGNEKNSRTSLHFYQLAYKFHETACLDIPFVYTCGILNNMARLHRQLENKDESTRCLQYLMSLLMLHMTRSRCYGIRPNRHMEEERSYLDHFLKSALSVLEMATSTAGAA